jgi:hypothetical protein
MWQLKACPFISGAPVRLLVLLSEVHQSHVLLARVRA